MTLPKKVAEQGRRSDELLRSLQAQGNNDNSDNRGDDPERQDPPKGGNDDDGKAQREQAGKEESAETWRNRYKALEGKYRNEVPRLHGSLRDLQQQNEELQRKLSEAGSSAHQSPPAPEPGSDNGAVDTSMYDEDLLAAIRQEARNELQRVAGDKLEKVDSLSQRDARREQESRQEQAQAEFVEAMDDLVPEWKEIDNDPHFHSYLAEPNPRTGNARQDDLVDAVTNLDTVGTARIFNDYLRNHAQRDREDDNRVPEHLRDPEPSGSTSVTDDEGAKRTYKRAEIKEIYKDIASGRYSDERAKEIEADIEKAYVEGRIR